MKRLTKADAAPTFIAKDYLGNAIDLGNYSDFKVLLSFFRGATCPFCNLRLNQLIHAYPEFEKKGIEIIAIFAASGSEILAHGGDRVCPFPIVADPALEIYMKYAVEKSSLGMIRTLIKPLKMIRVMFSGYFNLNSVSDRPIVPADFLIDRDQNIHTAYYGSDFGDHTPVKDILDWKS